MLSAAFEDITELRSLLQNLGTIMKTWKTCIVAAIIMLVAYTTDSVGADRFRVAVFDLKADSGVSRSTTSLLSDLLRKDLAATHRMIVMDRNDMETILEAQGMNLRDCTEEGCAIKLGRILDTDKLIVGSVSILGGRYILYAKMVDLESGQMLFAEDVTASTDVRNLPQYISELVTKLGEHITLTGTVLHIVDSQILVDLGANIGIEKGATFIVDRKGDAIRDPSTGEIKGYQWEEIARLQVIDFSGTDISRCIVLQSTQEDKTGDRVREIQLGRKMKNMGVVALHIEPGEVYVVIDGIPSGIVTIPESGLLKMNFSAGSHTFAFSRQGKQDWHKESVVKVDETLDESVVFLVGQSRMEEPIGYGILIVRSEPSGATVLIDNVERGVTPHQVRQLAVGNHTVEIVKQLYKPYREEVEMEPDAISEVTCLLEPEFAHLTIYSTPPGAMVYINGQQKNLTPIEIERFPSGNYELRLVKQLYHEHQQTFEVEPGVPIPINIALEPAFGAMTITSTPTGAKVFVGGQYWGLTPQKRDTIPSGQHTVIVQMDMYNDFETIKSVRDGEETVVAADLGANFGTIEISSDPKGAEVYVVGDDRSWGKTPLTKRLQPGVYRIQIQKDLYELHEQSVNLGLGEIERITVSLTRRTGRFVIFTEPLDADVYLDGKHMGQSPLIIKEQPTGTYEIVLKLSQYAEHREEITVRDGEETKIDRKLSKTEYLLYRERKRTAFILSAIMPGTGQVFSKQSYRGLAYFCCT